MDIKAILMGLAFVLMWSSAFTSARIIVTQAPPLSVSALRFLLAGIVTLFIARVVMKQSFRLTAAQWRLTIVFGICQNAIYLGLNFTAMQWIEASLAAIIASTLPLIVAALGWLLWRERLPLIGIAGLFAGFGGVALIMGTRLTGGVDPLGVALCAIAALALAIATLSVRGASSGGNVLVVVGMQMLVGTAALLPFALIFETWDVTWTPSLVAALSYTIIVPGVIATVVWFLLVGRIGAVRAAAFHFLNPFFGVLVAALLLDERIGPMDILGVLVITVSILAVQMSKISARKP